MSQALVERTTLVIGAGGGMSVALGVAALVLVVVLGWLSVTNLPRRRAAWLVGMRTALALVVVLVALRLELKRESLAISAAPIAIVVDASTSMGVRDQGGGTTRLEAASAWLDAHRESIAQLASGTTIDWFAASEGTLTSIGSAQDVATLIPSGGTDLLGSLRALAERYPGRARPETLLLSDGADHGEIGRRVAAATATSASPDLAILPPGGRIVAVAPGTSGFADRAVDLVARDPVGFLRTEITVRARVRAVGLAAAEIPVTLLRGDDVVQVRTVSLGGAAGTSADVTFRLSPARVGEAMHRVQVPLAAGEAVSSNNEVAFSVRVVRDRIRVLQVVGRPSWDGRFLRELLKRDPAVDLISFFILRSQWDDTNADVEELSLIPFPVTELFDEKLASFDLVIFQDFNFAPYGIEPYLDQLRKQVLDGGAGLAVVGGDLAFGRDYGGPDMSAVLPVQVPPAATWQGSEVDVEATDAGLRHPVMRLGGEGHQVADAVRELLPVTGLNRGLVPKDGASVLLRTSDSSHRPVVVASEQGHGRVLVVATDGTWRWSLPMAGRTGSARTYERFWDNALRWLVKDERSSLLLLEADRRSAAPRESVELRVHVRTESYEPEAGVAVSLTITDASGAEVKKETVEAGEDGVARLVFEPQAAGLYSVVASSARGDAGPIYIECEDRSAELADAAVHADVLDALAKATGGVVLPASEHDGKLPLAARREERLESARVLPLWRTWWAWTLVAGLACSEWWLRRRWGLA